MLQDDVTGDVCVVLSAFLVHVNIFLLSAQVLKDCKVADSRPGDR